MTHFVAVLFNLVIGWRLQSWLKGQSHILKIAIMVPRKRLSRAIAATFWPRSARRPRGPNVKNGVIYLSIRSFMSPRFYLTAVAINEWSHITGYHGCNYNSRHICSLFVSWPPFRCTLQCRNYGCDSVSNHQPQDCLLNRLFRRRSKKTSKLRVIGLSMGNSPGTDEFPAQTASYAENFSIWWRHHEISMCLPSYISTASTDICQRTATAEIDEMVQNPISRILTHLNA